MDEAEAAWFHARWRQTGQELDMGKTSVRFRKLGDVPLEVVGEAVARVPVDSFIAAYERGRGRSAAAAAAGRPADHAAGAARTRRRAATIRLICDQTCLPHRPEDQPA